MDEGFSGVARTWSDGASGGDLVTFFLYLGLDVSDLSPVASPRGPTLFIPARLSVWLFGVGGLTV